MSAACCSKKRSARASPWCPIAAPANRQPIFVAGNIDVLLDTPALSLVQHRAGNVKAFAVANNRRLATAPEIRPRRGSCRLLFHILARALGTEGTPKEIIAKLNEAAVKALDDPNFKARLADLSKRSLSARAAHAGSARRLSSRRDREMVADHQAADIKVQ